MISSRKQDMTSNDKSLFSPAEVIINEVSTGKVYQVVTAVTLKSFDKTGIRNGIMPTLFPQD